MIHQIDLQAAHTPPLRSPAVRAGLSVIIVNWNTRDLLAQCLESVIRQQSPDLRQQSNSAGHLSVVCTLSSDVWVIDNASSDGSAAMVRERFPQVHLIENQERGLVSTVRLQYRDRGFPRERAGVDVLRGTGRRGASSVPGGSRSVNPHEKSVGVVQWARHDGIPDAITQELTRSG